MTNSVEVTKQNTLVSAPIEHKHSNGLVKKILAKCAIYLVLLLLYAPLIYITVYSFSASKTTGVWSSFTFDNYATLFSSNNAYAKAIWSAAGNTMIVAISAALISTVLGTLGAIGMFYLRNKFCKSSLNFMTQIPIVNAEIVTAVSLCVLFAVLSRAIGLERNMLTLIIGHCVLALPYVVISVTPKLEQMDPALYEAAIDLGANRVQALWKVIIPEIVPGILSGFMLSITLSLDDFVITAFTKPSTKGFNTISTYVDGITAKGPLPKQLRAFTAVLFAVILIVMIGMNVKMSIDRRKAKKFIKE